LTVAENIAITNELSNDSNFVNWKDMKEIAKKALKRVDIDIDINKTVEELSVADKQLVAIARALLYNAKLIVMDEPTTALTRKEVNNLFEVIEDLKNEGISILFVSHKLNEVFQISDYITILRNGKKVFDGPAEDLNRQKLEYHMTGRNLNEKKPYEFETDESPVLKVDKLSKKDKYKNVSFDLAGGEILGITGLLGSGRTELALSLFGLKPADSGEIFIDNKKVEISDVKDAINNKMAYVPEDRLTEGLLLEKSIGNNINICTIDKLINQYKLIDEQQKNEQIDKWIDQLSIKASSADAPVSSLSGGNQQRVVLAKWLATYPKVLILNGPTVGVDVGSKEEIHNLLRNLAAEGMGIILISDDIPEVVNNCSRILLMKQGEMVDEFLGTEIDEDKLSDKLLDLK
jgi:simple sugar transport system ATP-binding protein